MRSIYVAAPWRLRPLVREYTAEVVELGVVCHNTWQNDSTSMIQVMKPLANHVPRIGDMSLLAAEQVAQISEADMLVCVSNEGSPDPAGARHWQTGYALGSGKMAALVGRGEHLFHSLETPRFVRFPKWGDFVVWLVDHMVDAANPNGSSVTTLRKEVRRDPL